MENYLSSGAWRGHSFALSRAFGIIKSAFYGDAYKLNDPHMPYYPSDILDRIAAAVSFVRHVIDEIGKVDPLPRPVRLRQKKQGTPNLSDIYDEVAELMFKLVLAASHVKSDQDRAWSVQYNAVWSNFFGFSTREKAWLIVHYKLRRLIFDEITQMPHLNYLSARLLGLCLNVLSFDSWTGQAQGERSLQKAIIAWTKRNFVKLWDINPEVAESGLPAGLAFDRENHRLVKTYAKGLRREAPKVYLELDG